jgi:hypothetical protein
MQLSRVRRQNHETITINGDEVIIRDQAPLFIRNVTLGSGLSFEDFVFMLNRHVFFWPGNDIFPIGHGLRHFQRYSEENTVVIRVPLLDTIYANPDRAALVCKYNSGSPRCSHGHPSPRGLDTFTPLDQSKLGIREVVEIAFSPDVFLPASSFVSKTLGGDWMPL